MTDEHGAWRTYGEKTIYDNRWVRLGLVDVEAPNGERWDYHVVHFGRIAIAMIVNEQDDTVLMLWRYRFATDQWGYELLGGLVEEGEDPAATAAREAVEESGWGARWRAREADQLRAASWQRHGSCGCLPVAPGRTDRRAHRHGGSRTTGVDPSGAYPEFGTTGGDPRQRRGCAAPLLFGRAAIHLMRQMAGRCLTMQLRSLRPENVFVSKTDVAYRRAGSADDAGDRSWRMRCRAA